MVKKNFAGVSEILAQDIIEPVDPMRSDIDAEKISDLAESIKKQGLINPLTVRPVGSKFEIVAGHRRFKACVIAGVFKIPCVVRTMSDQEVWALRAHENLFRDDIDPVDEALYIGKLVGTNEEKIPEVAKMLNRSVLWVEDRLSILSYPDYFLPALKASKIKLGVAKALVQIEDDVYRKMFFNNALRDGMTVWQADYFLSQWQNGVFKDSSEIIVPTENPKNNQPARIRQQCAKCGKAAETPNLQNVFIHIDCPDDVGEGGDGR